MHNATPNHLHCGGDARRARRRASTSSRTSRWRVTAAEAKQLVDAAQRAGVVAAVTFNYRGNPLVQQARHAIARGDIGAPHFVHGYYLQDWLLKDTDYSWRLDPEKGGASSALGDIGSHWCDLAQHLTGLRITHVLGDITTAVPTAQEAARIARGIPDRRRRRGGRGGHHASRISRRCSCASRTARRAASRSVRCARATRTISCSRCAARRRRCAGGRSIRTSCGSAIATRANEMLQKDPSLLDADARGLRAPAGRPSGGVGRRLLQPDARHLRLDCRRSAVSARCRRWSRRSRTATAPTASSRRFSTSAGRGGVWTNVDQ